jgi:hypothetical protein
VYGEGEWKVRQHGASKRRTWIKVHLAVDSTLRDVVGVEVTTPEWTDEEVFEGLVDQIEGDIEQIKPMVLMIRVQSMKRRVSATHGSLCHLETMPSLGKKDTRAPKPLLTVLNRA